MGAARLRKMPAAWSLLVASLAAVVACVAAAAQSDYAFVVMSDIHIGEGMPAYDGSELYSNVHAKEAIRKINELTPEENIRLVLITGDLTDSAEEREYAVCREVLDLLDVPYSPAIGNHDVCIEHSKESCLTPHFFFLHQIKFYTDYNSSDVAEGDQTFQRTFGDLLQGEMGPGIQIAYKAPETWNSQRNITSLFQNWVVQIDGPSGLNLVVLDWNTRLAPFRPDYVDRGVGPWADLHDFPGGTINWLEETLPRLYTNNASQVAFFQHHPYRLQFYAPDRIYGFDRNEKARIQQVLRDSMPLEKYKGVFAGHLHRFYEGLAFDEEGFENFGQWETDTCKGHLMDRIPKNQYGAFTLVRVQNNLIVSIEQFSGPYYPEEPTSSSQ